MQKRVIYMVFAHCEYVSLFPKLTDAQDCAESHSGKIVKQKMTLAQVQECLEREISDDEWDEFEQEGEDCDD